MVRQRLPGGQRRERQRRRCHVGERLRLGGQADGGHDHVLGGRAIPVEVDQADHLIAHGQAGDAVPEAGHGARHLMGRYDRRPVGTVPGGPLQIPGQLREGNRRGVHGDERLARPGGRRRRLLVDQLPGPAASMRPQRHHSAHRGSSSVPAIGYRAFWPEPGQGPGAAIIFLMPHKPELQSLPESVTHPKLVTCHTKRGNSGTRRSPGAGPRRRGPGRPVRLGGSAGAAHRRDVPVRRHPALAGRRAVQHRQPGWWAFWPGWKRAAVRWVAAAGTPATLRDRAGARGRCR